MTVNPERIVVGGSATIVWDFDAMEIGVSPDLVVWCWDSEQWHAAWLLLDVVGSPSIIPLEPGQDVALPDASVGGVGRLLVPTDAPPGTYMIEGTSFRGLFAVIEAAESDG